MLLSKLQQLVPQISLENELTVSEIISKTINCSALYYHLSITKDFTISHLSFFKQLTKIPLSC